MVANATSTAAARYCRAIPQSEPLQRQCATRRDLHPAKERQAGGPVKDRNVVPIPGNGERAGHGWEAIGAIGGVFDSCQRMRAGLQANVILLLPVRVRLCDGRDEARRVCGTTMKG